MPRTRICARLDLLPTGFACKPIRLAPLGWMQRFNDCDSLRGGRSVNFGSMMGSRWTRKFAWIATLGHLGTELERDGFSFRGARILHGTKSHMELRNTIKRKLLTSPIRSKTILQTGSLKRHKVIQVLQPLCTGGCFRNDS